jgi:hypothetical protein
MIRALTRADIAPCVRLLEKFWYESTSHVHFGEWNPVYVQRTFDKHLSSGLLVGWASFDVHSKMDSVLVAIRDKCFWKDIELLREIAWYTKQNSRGKIGAIRVYKEAEKFAIENNIKKIIMGRIRGVPSYDKLNSFYLKNNFKSLEDEYIKEL